MKPVDGTSSNKPWHFGMHEHIGHNWLLLRGLSRESAHWGNFPALLQARFQAARIATLDLPGSGEHFRLTSPNHIGAIVEHVRADAKRKGLLDRPLTLLGLSLGGMVAWEWASQHPAEVNALALINSSFASLSPFYRRLRWQNYSRLLDIVLRQDLAGREREILGWICNRADCIEQTVAVWTEIQRRRPVAFSATLNQLIAAARYRPAEARPSQPIILLNSQRDRLVDPACSRAIASHWQLPLETHPWAGHDLPLDDGDWLAEMLVNWSNIQPDTNLPKITGQ